MKSSAQLEVGRVKVGRSLRERRLGRQSTACRGLPALPICVCCRASVSIGWIYGSPGPQKAASHNSTMGGRGELVLYHDQLRSAGQKPIVSCRHWRCRPRRDELQPREIRLALPPVPAYAGSSARDHGVPARTGNGNNHQELEKVRCRKTWRRLATRFFRSSLARPSRTGRENQLHPDESGPQRIVPATGGLGVVLSSKRPPAAALVGRVTPVRAVLWDRTPRLAQECEPYRLPLRLRLSPAAGCQHASVE